MAEKSRILIIGATGYIGKFITSASVKAGHATFAVVRESTLSNPVKAKLVDDFKSSGVKLFPGDLFDREGLVKAINQVDVVISMVGKDHLANQDELVAAIKEAGNVKAKIRRVVEAEGIPYTYVCSNTFAGYFLPSVCQPGILASAPPRDRVVIFRDGNTKAIYNKEEDIVNYTIGAADDTRTLNKTLYIRPPENMLSVNDLLSMWEKKIGKTLERNYVPEEQVLGNIHESSGHVSMILSIVHSVFMKGGQTNFEIEPSFGAEASESYPDIKYTTVDEYLNQFI
ncbi:hypothetical protein CRG98_041498 [Punica granatum]|nr:hypothetical protein CRG98_041498 [Punica granatum]